MKTLQANNIDDLLILASRLLLEEGKERSPKGYKTIEISKVEFILENPNNSVVQLPERKLNKNYLAAEFYWFLKGDYQAEKISSYASLWKEVADEDGCVHSNYGQIALRDLFNSTTQYQWCKQKLIEDKETRQATIEYLQPIKHKYPNNKDVPCTWSQLFRIDEDKLNSEVYMRSND